MPSTPFELCLEYKFDELKQAMKCRAECEDRLRQYCRERYGRGPLAAMCHMCVLRWLYGKPCYNPFIEDVNICSCPSFREICEPYFLVYGSAKF